MKTIAQQLSIKKFPFKIKDERGNKIYDETSDGFWYKKEYDERGNITYFKNSDGFWYKKEYNERGNEIYFEDSHGIIKDNRPKPKPEYTMEQLIEKLGEDFKLVK